MDWWSTRTEREEFINNCQTDDEVYNFISPILSMERSSFYKATGEPKAYLKLFCEKNFICSLNELLKYYPGMIYLTISIIGHPFALKALLYSIKIGNVNIVRHLLLNKMRISAKNEHNSNAIHYCIYYKQFESLKLILDFARTKQQIEEIFFSTISFNNIFFLEYFLQEKSKNYVNNIYIVYKNIIDKNNMNALHYAAIANRWEIAKYLIDKGININQKSIEERTPFLQAIYCKNFLFAQKLMKFCGNSLEISNVDIYGNNAFHLSFIPLIFNHLNYLPKKVLKERENVDGKIPINEEERRNFIGEILEHEKINVNIFNLKKLKGIHLAIKRSSKIDPKTIEFLLPKLAEKSDLKNDQKLFQIAISQPNFSTIFYYFKNNFIDEKREKKIKKREEKIVFDLVSKNQINELKYLVEKLKIDSSKIFYYFNEDFLNNNNYFIHKNNEKNLLYFALYNNSFDIIKYLIEEVKLKYEFALFHAIKFSKNRLIKYLLNNKICDINLLDNNNKTILYYLNENSFDLIPFDQLIINRIENYNLIISNQSNKLKKKILKKGLLFDRENGDKIFTKFINNNYHFAITKELIWITRYFIDHLFDYLENQIGKNNNNNLFHQFFDHILKLEIFSRSLLPSPLSSSSISVVDWKNNFILVLSNINFKK